MVESRKFTRLKDNILISGHLVPETFRGFKAFTRDISAGGLMFETDRNIPEGSYLEMEIYQPIVHNKKMIFSINVLAKTIWTSKIIKHDFQKWENRYKVGIEFSEIKEEDRQKIRNFVNESIF